jgi:hypothetical protein
LVGLLVVGALVIAIGAVMAITEPGWTAYVYLGCALVLTGRVAVS